MEDRNHDLAWNKLYNGIHCIQCSTCKTVNRLVHKNTHYRGVKIHKTTCTARQQQKSCRPMTSKNLPLLIALSNGLTLLKIPPYNTTWSALHKHTWSDKNTEWPHWEWQMYKCQESEVVWTSRLHLLKPLLQASIFVLVRTFNVLHIYRLNYA